jgi:hypothetical protein
VKSLLLEVGRSPSPVRLGPDDDLPICAFVRDANAWEPPRHPTQFDKRSGGGELGCLNKGPRAFQTLPVTVRCSLMPGGLRGATPQASLNRFNWFLPARLGPQWHARYAASSSVRQSSVCCCVWSSDHTFGSRV